MRVVGLVGKIEAQTIVRLPTRESSTIESFPETNFIVVNPDGMFLLSRISLQSFRVYAHYLTKYFRVESILK